MAAAARGSASSPLHYRPARGRLGDTIPFFWKGVYHVYYLLCDAGPTIPWEHIASEDLVHWRDLPTALEADPTQPEGADGFNMFTGCIVESGGIFHLHYTGFNPKNPEGREHICHATSLDLVTWTKHPEHRFRADGVAYLNRDFRDPFVFWNHDERCWWMLLCAADAATGLAVQGRARSRDLVTWEQLPPLRFDPPILEGETGAPECPDLFRLGNEWILLYTRRVQNIRRADDILGPYRPANPAELDTSLLLAGKSMFDGKRHIYVGPVSGDTGDTVMCLPREIRAAPGGGVAVLPVGEAVDLFGRHAPGYPLGKPFDVPAARRELETPGDYLLEAEVTLTTGAELVVAFRGRPESGTGCRLALRPSAGEIELGGRSRACPLPVGRPVKVQAFVQGTVVECFVDGRYALTARVYDGIAGRLSLGGAGGRATVHSLDLRVPEA